MWDNRHSIMGSGGAGHYEVIYCDFGDSWEYLYVYNGVGSSPNQQHQVDQHDGNPAGDTMVVHYCTFSANNSAQPTNPKPNVCLRGIASRFYLVEHCWTKKTYRSGGPYDETTVNSAFTCATSDAGSLPSGTLLSSRNMIVRDNWYGTTPPPDVLGKMAVNVVVTKR